MLASFIKISKKEKKMIEFIQHYWPVLLIVWWILVVSIASVLLFYILRLVKSSYERLIVTTIERTSYKMFSKVLLEMNKIDKEYKKSLASLEFEVDRFFEANIECSMATSKNISKHSRKFAELLDAYSEVMAKTTLPLVDEIEKISLGIDDLLYAFEKLNKESTVIKTQQQEIENLQRRSKKKHHDH